MTKNTHYFAPSARAEILGAQLMGLLGSINHDQILPFLEKYHLDRIDPEHWYNMQMIGDLFADLTDAPGGMFDLVGVGMNSVMINRIPPGMHDLKAFVQMLPQMLKTGVRNCHVDELLKIEIEDAGENQLQLNIQTIMSPDMLYGLFYGIARKVVGPEVVIQRTDPGKDVIHFDIHW